MTLQATTRRSPTYTGTGVSVPYAFAFKVFSAADVAVYTADTTGAESQMIGGYTVALNSDQESSPGGSVTLATPLPAGFRLTLVGGVALSQPADLPDGGSYRAQTVEDALDRATMQLQQVDEKVSRAILLPVNAGQTPPQLPVPVPNGFIGWDSEAEKLVNLDAAELVTAVAYGSVSVTPFVGTGVALQSVVLDTNPASINNILVFIEGAAQTPGDDFVWDSNRTIIFSAPVTLGAAGFVRYNQALPVGEVAANSVTTSKIQDGAVTLDKLATDTTLALVGASSRQKIQPLTAALTGGSFGAMQITLAPTVLDFLFGTQVVVQEVFTPLTLVVPATASLGAPAAAPVSTLAVVAFLASGGGVALGVVNLAGGVSVDESAPANAALIGASSLLANTIYASAAQTSRPYRVVGLIQAIWVSGSGWSSGSLKTLGAGLQATAALSSFGMGQLYRPSGGARALGVSYYNPSSRPIFVTVTAVFTGAGGTLNAVVGTENAGGSAPSHGATAVNVCFVVPPGQRYVVTSAGGTVSALQWSEMS